MQEVLSGNLDGKLREEVSTYIGMALSSIENVPVEDIPAQLDSAAKSYVDALLKGDRRHARSLILGLADQGTPLDKIYIDVLQTAQREIGRLWHVNEISVAHEHFCTAATQSIMSELYPYIANSPRKGFKLIATAVPGEIHEVGIRMVADFFEMDGWDTYYVGANTPQSDLMRLIREQKPHVLALSASTALNLGAASEILSAVQDLGERPRTLVGGRIFNHNPDLWRHIGADGFAADAPDAVACANRLVVS
jgi:methanogenic corrinoid protein MtbC1